MVKVVARDFLKPECVEEFLSITKELVEKTNRLDPGCISYELCRDLKDPLRFAMVEAWKDQESLDAHMKSPHFVELVPKMGALCSQPSELTLMEKVY